MLTIDQIIEKAGGVEAVADIVGKKPDAVRKWPRDGIPWIHFSPLKDETGISLDELASANAGTPRASRPSARASAEMREAG